MRYMDPLLQPSRRRYRNQVFVWDKKFTNRQKLAYRAEDNKLLPEAHQTLVTAFLEEQASRLDPPKYSYTGIRAYLERADENSLRTIPTPPGYNETLVWIDDRRDNTGWRDAAGIERSARNWDEYVRYPPEGEDVHCDVLDLGDFYRRLSQNVCGHGALAELL